MKKILGLILLLAFYAGVSWAQEAKDYYVYVRMEDRFGVSDLKTSGKSKKGDVVDIRLANYEPTEKEKAEYSIIKVSGLTPSEIKDYKDPLTDENHKQLAYRKNKFDVDAFGSKKGYDRTKKHDHSVLKSKIKQKTSTDLSYYKAGTILYAMTNPVREFFEPKYAFASVTSTINKAGEDYASLTLWEDAKDGDPDTTQTALCYDDLGPLDDQFEISGWADGSVVTVTAPEGERHNGTAASGFTIQKQTAGNWTNSDIWMNDSKITVTISWLVIKELNESHAYGGPVVWEGGGDDTLYFHDNIVAARETPGGNGIQAVSLTMGGGDPGPGSFAHIYNNVIYGFSVNGTCLSYGPGMWATMYSYVYNNTVYGCKFGIESTADSSRTHVSIAANNISYGNTTENYSATSTFDEGTTNNLSSGTDAPQLGTYYNSKTLAFANAAGKDFHLAATDTDAIGKGVDLSSDFTNDIDNQTRSTWDLGADFLYVAPPPSYYRAVIHSGVL